MNVIVDNLEVYYLKVIYEDDFIIGNLIGNIEYRNNNGGYIIDILLIIVGSLVKVNEGCLIMRLLFLVNSLLSYYYLKKVLIYG